MELKGLGFEIWDSGSGVRDLEFEVCIFGSGVFGLKFGATSMGAPPTDAPGINLVHGSCQSSTSTKKCTLLGSTQPFKIVGRGGGIGWRIVDCKGVCTPLWK